MTDRRLRARQVMGDVLYGLGMKRLQRRSLSVLMYHAVTPQPMNDAGQESIPVELFREQMGMLRRSGVQVVHLKEGIERLSTHQETNPMVSVVFDDGYVGVHDYAREILRAYAIPSMLFLATKSIGQTAFPWSPPCLGRPMTWDEVARVVREADVQVGSHTHTHPILSTLAASDVREELRESRALIEAKLNIRPECFAYPYGSYGTFSPLTRRLLAEEGFSIACVTVWGRHRQADDPLHVKRIRVSWCDRGRELQKSLAGCYDWYRFIQRRQGSQRVGVHAAQPDPVAG